MPSSPTATNSTKVTGAIGGKGVVGAAATTTDDTTTTSKKVLGLLESQRRLEEDIQTDLGLVAQAFDTYTTEGSRPNGLTFRKDANQRIVMHEKQRLQKLQHPLLSGGAAAAADTNNNNYADRDDAIRAQRIEDSKQRGRVAAAANGNHNPLQLETDAALLAAGYDDNNGRGDDSSSSSHPAKQRHLVDARGGIPLYPLIHQALPYAMFRKFHPSQGDVALRRKAMPKVLIADDNKLHLMASKVIFEKYFETVHVCTTGKGVLEAMQRTVYDLILLDFDMSGINDSVIALRPEAIMSTTINPSTTATNPQGRDTINGNPSLPSSPLTPSVPPMVDPLTDTPIKTIKDVSYSNYAPDIADTIRAVENAGKFETKSLIVCMMTKEQSMDEDIMERCHLSSLDRFILKPLIHHANLIRDAISTSSVTETFRRTVLEKKWFSNRINTIALLQGTVEDQERVHKLVQASNPDYANEAHITTLFDDSPDERLQIETLLARQRDEELHALRDEVCSLRNEVNELSYRNEQLEVENCVLRKDQHLETIWRLQRQVESLQADFLTSTRREEEERDRAKQIETDLRNLLENGSKNEKHVEAAVRHALHHRKALEKKEQVCMELLDTASRASWYNYYGSIEVRSLEGIASESLPKFATDVGTSWFREQLSKMIQSIEKLSSSLLSEVLSTRGDITRAIREATTISSPPSTSSPAAFSAVPSRTFGSGSVAGAGGGGGGLAAYIDQITSRLKEVASAAEENLGGMIKALEEGVANVMVREHTLWSMIEKEEGDALNKELSTIQGFIREQRIKKLNNSVECQTEVWREIGTESYNTPPIEDDDAEVENASESTKTRRGDTLQTVGVETMKEHIAARRNVFADPSLVLAQLPTVTISDGVRFVPNSRSSAIQILSDEDENEFEEADDSDDHTHATTNHTNNNDTTGVDHAEDNTFLTGTGAVATSSGINSRSKYGTKVDPDADLDDLEDLLNAGVDADGRALSEVDIGAERRRIIKMRRERFDSRAEKRAKKEAREKRRQCLAEKRLQLEEEEKEFKRRITYLQQSTLLQDISCHDLLPLLHNNTTFISQSVREKMILDVFDKVAAFERGVKSKVATIARALYDQLEASNQLMEIVKLPGISSSPAHQPLLSTFALKRAHIQNLKNEGLPSPPEALLLTTDLDTLLDSVSPALRDEYYHQQDGLASMFPLLHALYQDHSLAALNLPQHATQQDDAPLETLFNACDNVVPITRLLLEKLSIHSAITLGVVSTPSTTNGSLQAGRRSIHNASFSSAPGGRSADSVMGGSGGGGASQVGGSSLQIAFSQLGHAIRADLPEDISGLPSVAGGAAAMIGGGLTRNSSMSHIQGKSTLNRPRQTMTNKRGNGVLTLKDRLAKAMAIDAAKARGGGSGGGGQNDAGGDASGRQRQDPIAAVQSERAAIKNHLWSILATSRKAAAAKDSEVEAEKAKKIEMRKTQKKRLKKKRRMDEAIAKKRIERAQKAEEREAANALAIANGEEPIPDASVRKRRGGRGGRRVTTDDEISDMNTADMSSSEGVVGGGGDRRSDGRSPGHEGLSPYSESDDPFEEVELLSGETSGAVMNAATSGPLRSSSSVFTGPSMPRHSFDTQCPSVHSQTGSRSDSIFNVPPPLHQHGNKLTAPNANTSKTATTSSATLVNVSSLLYHEDSSAPTLLSYNSHQGAGGKGDSPLTEYLFFDYDPDTDHVHSTTVDEYDDNDSVLSGSFATESSLVNGSFRLSSAHGGGSVGMSSPVPHHHTTTGGASSPIPPPSHSSPSPRPRPDRRGRKASKPIPAGADKAEHIREERRMMAMMTNIAVVAEAANRLDTESHKTASSIAEFAQGKVVGAMLRNATALSGAGRGSSPPSSDVSGRVNQQSQAAAGFDRPTVAVSMKELALLQKRLQQEEDERDDLLRKNLLQRQRADASAGKTNVVVAAQLQALTAKRAKQKASLSFEHWFSMADVAKIFDVDVSEMRALNPALPPSLGDFDGLEKAAGASSVPSSAQGGSKPSATNVPKSSTTSKMSSSMMPLTVVGDGDIVLHIPISIKMAGKVFAMGGGDDEDAMDISLTDSQYRRPNRTNSTGAGMDLIPNQEESTATNTTTSNPKKHPFPSPRQSITTTSTSNSTTSKSERKSVFGSGALLGLSGDGGEGTNLRAPSPTHSQASSGVKRRSNLADLLNNALQDNSVLKAAAVKQYHDKLAKRGTIQTSRGGASGSASTIASPHGSMTSRPSILSHSATGAENSGQPKPLTDTTVPDAATTTATTTASTRTDQPNPTVTTNGVIPAVNTGKKGTLRIKSNFHHKLLQAILRTQHDIIASHAKEDQVRDTKNKLDFVEATLAAGGKDEKGRMVSEWGKYAVDHSRVDGSYALERRVAPSTTSISANKLANGTASSSFASPSGVWRSLRVVDRSTCTTDDTILSLSMLVPPPSTSGIMVATTKQVKINPPAFTIPVTSVNSSIRTIHHEVGRLNKEFDLVTRSQRARRSIFLRQKCLHHYHRSGTKDGVPRPPMQENPNGTGYLYSSLPPTNSATRNKSIGGWNSVKMPSIGYAIVGPDGDDSPTRFRPPASAETQHPGGLMSASSSGTHIPSLPLPPGSSPGGAFSRASTAQLMDGPAVSNCDSLLLVPTVSLSTLRDNRDAYLMAEAKDAMKLLNIPTPVDVMDMYLTAPIVVSTQQDGLTLTNKKASLSSASGESTPSLVPSLPSLDTIQALRRLIASFGLKMPANSPPSSRHAKSDTSPSSTSSVEDKMAALLKAVYAAVLKIPASATGAPPEGGMSMEDMVLIEAAVKAAAQFVEGTTRGAYEGLLCIPRADCPTTEETTTTLTSSPPRQKGAGAKSRGSTELSDTPLVPTADVGSEEGGLLKVASASPSTLSNYNPSYLWERFVIDMEDILFDEELSRIAADREEDAAEHRKLLHHQTSGDISGLNTDGVDGGGDGTVGGASEWAALFTDFIKDIGSTPDNKKRQERAEKLRKERRLASRKAFESDLASKPSFLLNVRLHDILHVSRFICGIESDPHPSSTTTTTTSSPSSTLPVSSPPPLLKERIAALLLAPYPNEQLPYPTCTDADDILRLVEVVSRQVGAMVELALSPPVSSLTPFQARRLHYVAASTGTSTTHPQHAAASIASMNNNGSAVLGFRNAVTSPVLLPDNTTTAAAAANSSKPGQHPSTPTGEGFPKLRDRFKRAVVTVIDQQNKVASKEEGAKRLLKGAILYEVHPDSLSSSPSPTTISVTAERREWVFIPPQAFITHELSSAEISRFFVSEESSMTFLNATATVNKVKNLAGYLSELYPGVGAESIVYWNTGGRNPYHLQKSTAPINGADDGLDGDVLLDPRVVMSDVQRDSTTNNDDIDNDPSSQPQQQNNASKPLYEQFSSGTGFLNPAYAQMALKSSSISEPIKLRIPVQDREQFIARVMWHGDQLRRRHVLLLSTCLKERRQVDPEGLAWLAAAVQLPLDHLRAAVSLFSRAQKLFYHDCGYGGVLGGVGLPAGLVIDEPHMDDGAVWDDTPPAHSASINNKRKKIRKRPVSASTDSSEDMSENEDGVRRPRPRSHLFNVGESKSHSPSRKQSLEAPYRTPGDRASIFPIDNGESKALEVGVATRKQHSIERHMARLKRVRAMGTHIVTDVVPTSYIKNSGKRFIGNGGVSGGNSASASPESSHIEVPTQYSHRASISIDASGYGPSSITHLLSSQYRGTNTGGNSQMGVGNSRAPSTQRVGRGFSSNPASNAASPRETPNRGSPGKGTRFGVGAGRARANQFQHQPTASPHRTFLGVSAAAPPVQPNQGRAAPERHRNTTSPHQQSHGNPLTIDGGGGGGIRRQRSVSSSSAPFTDHHSSNSLHSTTLNPHHYPEGPLSAVDGVDQRQRSTSIGRANRQGSIRSELMLDGDSSIRGGGGGGLLLVAGSGLGIGRKSSVTGSNHTPTDPSSPHHHNLFTFVPLHNGNNNHGSVSVVTSSGGGGGDGVFGESPLVGLASSNASFSKSSTTDIRRGSIVKSHYSSFAAEQLHRHQQHGSIRGDGGVEGVSLIGGGGHDVGGSDCHNSSSALMSFVRPQHQSATNPRGGGGFSNNAVPPEDLGAQSLSISVNDVLKNRSTGNSSIHRRQPMRGSPLHGNDLHAMGSTSTNTSTAPVSALKRAGSPMVIMGHSTRGQPDLSPSVTSKDYFAPPPPQQRRLGGLGGGGQHGWDKDAMLVVGGTGMASSHSIHPARRGGGGELPSHPNYRGRGGAGGGLEEVSIIGGVSLLRHRTQQHQQSTRRTQSDVPISSTATTLVPPTASLLIPAPPNGAVQIPQGPSARRFNTHTNPALRPSSTNQGGEGSSSSTKPTGDPLSASILQTAISTHRQHNHNGAGPVVDTSSSSVSLGASSQRITLNRGVIRGTARFGSPSSSASLPPDGLQISGSPANGGFSSQFGWGGKGAAAPPPLVVNPTPPHAGRPGAPSSAPTSGGNTMGSGTVTSTSVRNVIDARRLTPPSIPPSLAFHRDK